jgi:hypothetical protein
VKTFLGTIFISICLSLSALANDEFSDPPIWQRALSCDGGAAVVDVDVQDRGPFHTGKAKQIVIRNGSIVSYFKSRGVAVNASNEVVLNVFGSYYDDLKGVHPEAIYGDDLKIYFSADGNGYRLYLEGYVQGYTDGDGQTHDSRRYEVANWHFNRCE